MQCKQRLYLTADKKKLVGEGHPKAAILYAVPGDEIPQSAADLFKLEGGHLKGFDPAAEQKDGDIKQRPVPGHKEKRSGDDKSSGASVPQGDDLTQLAGIGAKTADLLNKAGIASFSALAQIDPSTAPAVDGLSPTFKWPEVIEAAKVKAAPAQAA